MTASKYGSYSYPCGHTRRHLTEKIERLQRERPERCYDCEREHGRPEFERRGAELADAAKVAKGEAAGMAAAVPIPDAVPAPLAQEWRWWAQKHLVYAIAAERALGKTGAAGNARKAVTAELARIAAVMADPLAAADKGILRLADQAHWAAGWAHLAGSQPHPVSQDVLDAAAALIANLTEGYESLLPPDADTRNITGVLTHMITELPRRIETRYKSEDRFWTYRELRLPVVPDGKSRYGRLDVVIWHPGPGYADVAVEIDSEPNPSSAQKLAFARDAAAAAVWVRFGSGGITAPEGVAMIDLRRKP